MIKVGIVCEGPTEEGFVNKVLRPDFLPIGIVLVPLRVETSPGRWGGGLSYDRLKGDLRNSLRSRQYAAVTTLIDLYKLDTGFPGYQQAQRQRELAGRLEILNQAFHSDIVSFAGCRPERFIPYIQPYEFEALLFADVDSIVAQEPGWATAAKHLAEARLDAKTPEHINDSPQTKPAAQLQSHLRNPGFHKVRHGPQIASNIGLHRIEAECLFFAEWVSRLRSLKPTT